MAQQTGNPTILSPTSRFAIPHYRSYSRSPSLSPSRSPYRRQHFTSRELDPLLSNLSPTSTLEALTATQAISLNGEERQTALTTSIANASESERTFGIRAALAGKKLREWYQEVRGWSWPTGGRSKFNGFEMPSAEQRARNRSEYDHDGNIDPAIWGYAGSAALAGAEDEQYYGSIPVLVVTHYEKRIEEIADDMATLEVEELMEHVREAHLSRSRPTSSDGSPLSHPSPDDYNHLDDFTAVITTTILQALPYISRLDALLDVWSIRLSVLRQVPKFLRWLEEAQIAMGSAWHAIGSSPGGAPVKTKSDISRRAFSTMKSILEEKILELGHGIDKMLDALEGRGDTVPDQWIDRMEGIEANFGSWVMEAEKQVMENELRFLKEREESHQRDMVPDRQKPGKQSSLSPDLNLTESHDLETYPLAMSSWLVEPASPNNARNEAGATPSAKKMVSTSALSNRRIPSQAVSEVPEGNDVQHPTLHSLMLTPNLVQPSPPSTPVYAETDMRSLLYAHVNALSQTADEDRGPGPGYHTHSGPHDAKLQSELGLPENTYITTPAAVDAPLMADLQRPFDRQLQPLQSHHSRNQSGVSTDTSYPGSATSEYFSDMSSPEIQDAVMVEYFSKATEVSTQSPVQSPPGSVSRASSRTERGSISTIRNVEGRTRDQTSSYSGSRASSVALEPMVPEFIGSSLEAAFGHGVNEVSPPRKTKSHDLQPKELPDVLGTSQALDYFTFKDSLEQSPSVRALSKRQSVAAANSALLTTISNPRSGFDDYSELGAENPSITSQQHQKSTEAWLDLDASPGESTETFSPSRSTEDQLEARISSILTDIPMRIKLASEPKSETLEDLPPRTSSIPKGLGIISPTLRSDKAQTGSPAVTIAPAFPRSARSRHSLPGDPEIKLYHLHQPGKEAPIKLFVRLVGDARERVMVRVGGGWADLGEYLKEYAIHHGRRSVTDDRFQIRGLPSPQTSPIPAASGNGWMTPGSGRATPGNGRSTPGNGRTTPGNGTTIPANGKRTPPSAFEFPIPQHPGSTTTLYLHNPLPSVLSSTPTLHLPLPLTPTIPARLSSANKTRHTPSRSAESIGYPSVGLHVRYPFPTNHVGSGGSGGVGGSVGSAGGRGGGDTPPLGLAGPRSRNKDISPGKQAWVDGMMEKARASGGKGEGVEGKRGEGWGDLGRVGGTRRLVLRGEGLRGREG